MSIDAVMDLGDDQLSSKYRVVFPKGIPGGGNADRVTLRADQDFDPPERSVTSYVINFQGLKVPKTSGVEESDKEGLTFTVRLDQQWDVYEDLKKWMDMVMNEETGASSPDAVTRTTLLLEALDADNQTVKYTITYSYAKLKTMKVQTFSNDGTEPSRLDLTFIFGKRTSSK